MMSFLSVFGQKELDTIPFKSNSIYFGEMIISYSSGAVKGFSGGFSFNYQRKNNLFTFRFLETSRIYEADYFLVFFPYNVFSKSLKEYSFLIGKRYIKNEFAYHFSGGISKVNFKETQDDILVSNDDYIGFPLEIGINWFNPQKERFKIFGFIPVGKLTSFGASSGIKLYANIAKKSSVGLGLTIGLGNYKNYGK
ncbi:hypothetical protein BTO13_10290 [Polaribacter gangjinensis]|uniref:Outer membrane protein beta-barrel domain-containing protein n=2 Tax=Polaribacter gangjinensis TaxID=574710 RepID=A0A2S7WG06_9FLAO|nr:hypothetical protein BTO13_10290 [Polaribacter gangjinensis]